MAFHIEIKYRKHPWLTTKHDILNPNVCEVQVPVHMLTTLTKLKFPVVCVTVIYRSLRAFSSSKILKWLNNFETWHFVQDFNVFDTEDREKRSIRCHVSAAVPPKRCLSLTKTKSSSEQNMKNITCSGSRWIVNIKSVA